MTNSLSSQQIYSPISATGISYNSDNVKAGRFVVNPQTIVPYSFYDDLKKGDNYFYEALNVLASKKMPPVKTKKKTSAFKKFVAFALLVGTGVLAYTKRSNIIKFFKNLKK